MAFVNESFDSPIPYSLLNLISLSSNYFFHVLFRSMSNYNRSKPFEAEKSFLIEMTLRVEYDWVEKCCLPKLNKTCLILIDFLP